MTSARPAKGIGGLVWQSLRRPVGRDYSAWRSFGWVLLLLILSEIVTGGLLAVYYEPVSDRAPDSVRAIMRDVRWGWLVRGLHHWTGQALVAFALALGAREVLTGGYRGRRAPVWVAGVLFTLALAAELVTGGMLRWDRAAHGLLEASSAALAALPVVGGTLSRFLAGGDEIGPQTLARLHSIHVFLLPWVIALLFVCALWILVRLAAREREEEGSHER